jgi:hypothetical protein
VPRTSSRSIGGTSIGSRRSSAWRSRAPDAPSTGRAEKRERGACTQAGGTSVAGRAFAASGMPSSARAPHRRRTLAFRSTGETLAGRRSGSAAPPAFDRFGQE